MQFDGNGLPANLGLMRWCIKLRHDCIPHTVFYPISIAMLTLGVTNTLDCRARTAWAERGDGHDEQQRAAVVRCDGAGGEISGPRTVAGRGDWRLPGADRTGGTESACLHHHYCRPGANLRTSSRSGYYGRPMARAVPRRSGGFEGPLQHQRYPHHQRLLGTGRSRTRSRCDRLGPAGRSRRGTARQIKHARVRLRRHGRHRLGHHSQPL